jgi:diacylglycerol kinase family enzyme
VAVREDAAVTETRFRCAVIYNPVKTSDAFVDTARQAVSDHGWPEPLWLATTEDDPGRGMVQEAVEAGVELVIAAGGDGTVRVVADGLAGSGIPLGVVPAGTANLLAYNLDLPTDEPAALGVALGGQDRRIDLVKITVDDSASQHFAVMAGAGFDAMIMDETDPGLKDKIGTAAYFLAVGKALGRLPMRTRIRIDGGPPRRRRAMVVLIGNVGKIKGGITLLPDARLDDGRLDVMIASPRTVLDWLKVVGRLITRRQQRDDPVEIHPARSIEVRLSEPDTYELDGDVAGEFTTLTADVVPGALVVRVPG